MWPKEIAELLGLKLNATYNLLYHMKNSGLIVQEFGDRSKYVLQSKESKDKKHPWSRMYHLRIKNLFWCYFNRLT